MTLHAPSHVKPRAAARLRASLRLLLIPAALCAPAAARAQTLYTTETHAQPTPHAQTPAPSPPPSQTPTPARTPSQPSPPAETPQADDEVLNVSTDLVTVPVFVTDARGRRVAGLQAADFRLRAAGRDAEISYFAAGTSRVALVFALDASGSAREHIARQREAALSLLARFGRGSRVAVLAFAESQNFTLPFSAEIERADAAFRIEARGRRTAIFDAALAAARAFDAGRPDPAERRIVVLLSDGLDTASRTRAPAVVAEAERRGVSFYVLHLPLYEPRWDGLAVRRPASGFRALADRTGGKYFLLGDERQALAPSPHYDLAPVFRAIADDLQSQYVLGFYADDAARAAGEQKLEVRLAPRAPRLRVHALRDTFSLKSRDR